MRLCGIYLRAIVHPVSYILYGMMSLTVILLTHWLLGDLNLILEVILVNSGWGIFYEIALRWMPLDLTDDKSTLVQVMAWCRQATSHYLGQCWPRSMSPNGVTRPQWVKIIAISPGYNELTKQIKSLHIHEVVQERLNPSALAMELRLSCINPSSTWRCGIKYPQI